MTSFPKILVVLAAAACAALAADPAEAKGGGRFRARADFAALAGSPAEGAKLSVRLREKSHDRFEFRMQIERAPDGLSPEAFIADAVGTLVSAGAFVPDDDTSGEYKLRIRNGTLPAGATTISDLAGRAFEVRDGAAVLFSGTIPSTRSGGGGADDGANHDADDDHGGGSGGGGSGRGGHDDGPNHG